MASNNLVRAWKDEEYRLSLSEAELSMLPANPAGSLELTDADLSLVDGGFCLVSGINIVMPNINIVAGNICLQFARGGNVIGIQLSAILQDGGSNGVSVGASG
jgi:mersacidin/lichenicidin family type 2 lantibiotic